MAKRAYLQGEKRRKFGKSVWLSEDEAKQLEGLARQHGKSESDLARLALLKVMADIGSTAAVVTEDAIIDAQPMLFAKTIETGAGKAA
jgi:hypothetical protein